ncbi:Hmgcs1, partial [Symbiodinium sp. KB8]
TGAANVPVLASTCKWTPRTLPWFRPPLREAATGRSPDSISPSDPASGSSSAGGGEQGWWGAPGGAPHRLWVICTRALLPLGKGLLQVPPSLSPFEVNAAGDLIDGSGHAEGEVGHFVPEATMEEMQDVPLEELLQNERLGRLNQSGHLLMGLDQETADFVVVTERRSNVAPGLDYAHDVLHRLALRIVEESYGAERYGYGPVIRWATTTAYLACTPPARPGFDAMRSPPGSGATLPSTGSPVHCRYGSFEPGPAYPAQARCEAFCMHDGRSRKVASAMPVDRRGLFPPQRMLSVAAAGGA